MGRHGMAEKMERKSKETNRRPGWIRGGEKPGRKPDSFNLADPWSLKVAKLYDGLTKAEATALFLLRTEVIGLNAWLASVRVPDILPACTCGWWAQTVRHVLLHCPLYERASLIRQAQTESLPAILSQPAGARAAAKWLIRNGILQQFNTAKAIGE